MNPARLKAYFLLLIVTIIWGVASPIIKFTLEGVGPIIFLTYRFAISTVVSIICFSIVGIHLPKKLSTLIWLLIYGFITSTVSLGLLFFGLKNTTVLDSSLITLIDPLLIALAGVYFLKEHITKMEKIGILIALAGTVLTIIEPLIQNHGNEIRFSGNLLIVGYVITTALGAVLAKKLLRQNVDALTLTSSSFIIGFITILPFALSQYSPIGIWKLVIGISPAYQAGVWFMALISGSLAYYLANKAQKTIEIGEQAVFGYLYPVFSTPLAVVWLGEKITPIFIIGAVIITLGVVIAEIKKRQYN
jgi:drug/metabolite transporter (DMT)-like permease